MSRAARAYVVGSAGQERTAAASLAAFARRAVVPRLLCDVAQRDLAVELFGRRLPAPLLAAPIGVLELSHPGADVAVAQAVPALSLPMVLSTQAPRPMEDCVAAAPSAARWFQLYWSSTEELVASFLSRA